MGEERQPTDVEVLAELVEWYRKMKIDGLAFADLMNSNKNPVLRERILKCWRTNGFNHTLDPKVAREIMGENYIGLDSVRKELKVAYTEEQLYALMRGIPFSTSTLERCAHSHILFPGYPLTIRDFMKMWPDFFNLSNFERHAREVIIDTPVETRWYLMSKSIVPGSNMKTYENQLGLLGDDEAVPKACEIVYASILYHLTNNGHIFLNYYVRCPELVGDGYMRHIGDFPSGRFDIDISRPDARRIDIGIAVLKTI